MISTDFLVKVQMGAKIAKQEGPRPAGGVATLTGRCRAHFPQIKPLPLAALVAIMLLSSCSHKAPPPPPTPTVKFLIVHTQSVRLSMDLPGRAVAYRTAEIRPQINGIVKNRMFTEGSEVRANQQLYQIDPALYRASLDSATATALSSAALVERYRPLAEAQAVSHQDFENSVATAAQNKAAAETARINLVYTRLL